MDDDTDDQESEKIKRWSSFQLDDAFERDKIMMKEKLDQLEIEIDEGFDASPEKARHFNFMAYLYWKFDDRPKAFAFVERAENLQEGANLITQCNKIIFNKESGEHSRAQKLLQTVKNDILTQEKPKIKANAEIAYCYSRLGPKYHGKAVQLFRKAIDDIYPERNIAWEYGLALSLRRQSHIFQMSQPSDFKPDENKKEAANLLYGVVSSPVSTYRQIKAWSWCELGKIIHINTRLDEIIDTLKTETEIIDNTRCFEEALKLCPNDPYVLQLYGTHLRYNNQLQKSREVFQRVLGLRDENISRHHLALTLKRMVEKTRRKVPHPLSVYFGNQRKDNQHQPGSLSLNHNFKAKIKSPRYVCISPDDQLLLEAVEHLKKSIEMCAVFNTARYDLGLIYRMLDKPDEALKYFAYITSSNCGKMNDHKYPMQLVNAYEQQAICKLEIIEKESNTERKNEHRYDARQCLWNALTVISGIIGAVPNLKTTCQCFPTLKILLQNEEKCSKTLKDLAELHEKMGYTEESIKFVKEIYEIDNDPKMLKKLADNYLKVGDFENAICTLLLLQYTKEIGESDISLFIDAYINGARDSLKKGNFEMAKIRLSKAYGTIFSDSNVAIQDKREDESFPDVLILDGCGEEGVCRWVKPIISTFVSFIQLHVVVNYTDCPPGVRIPKYLEKTMFQARCILLILHECDDANKDSFIELALEQLALCHRTKTLLIRIKGCHLEFPGCRELELSLDPAISENNVMQGTLLSNILEKMTEIFIKFKK